MRWWKLELHTALELADEILAVAEDVQDPAMLLTGYRARGTTLFFLGELVSANGHLEKALAVFGLRATSSRGVGGTQVRCALVLVL